MSETETTEAPATEAPSAGATNHLYLVDGSSYIFRAYHRLPPLTNRHGQPAGAVYGYTAMLWKLADGLNKADGPTHMAVILDASEQTFRNEMYDQYKANRPPPPEDLVPQFPLIRAATRALFDPVHRGRGAGGRRHHRLLRDRGEGSRLAGDDRQLRQGSDAAGRRGRGHRHARHDERPPHRARAGAREVRRAAEKVGDVLALMGDSVDNVPGVPGVGPKTASQLIQQYGDLETVLALDRPDHQAQAEAVADRPCRQCAVEPRAGAAGVRFAAARAARGSRAQGHPARAAQGIPRGPGVQDAAAADDRAAAPQQTGATVRNDVMAAMEPKKPAVAEPEKIKVDRSKYETVTDEAALDRWIAEAHGPGLCRDRHRNRLHRLHHRQARRDQPGDRAKPRLLHPGRP